MPTYLFYDKNSGEILHIHREVFMDSGKTVELDPNQLLTEFKNLLPSGKDTGILTLEKDPPRERGYHYSVDTSTKKLRRIEKPPRQKEGL